MIRVYHQSMGILSRRRSFLALLLICCLSFFLFGWYTKMVDNHKETEDEEDYNSGLKEDYTDFQIPKEKEKVPLLSFQAIKNLDLSHFFGNRKAIEKGLQEEAKPSGPTDAPKAATPAMDAKDSGTEHKADASSVAELKADSSSATEHKVDSGSAAEHKDDSSSAAEHKDDSSSVAEKVADIQNSAPEEKSESSPTSGSDDSNPLLIATTNAPVLERPPKAPGLLLDNPGCKIPKLDPWDPTLQDIAATVAPYKCPGLPVFMKVEVDCSISLNESILHEHYGLKPNDLSCQYQGIQRKHEEPGYVRENDFILEDKVDLQFGVPIDKDYIGVFCYSEAKNETYEQYFPLVRLRKELEDQRSAIPQPEPKLNVILAGIDSVSKLNFLRQFKKTRAFLKDKMKPFDMKGYTKVGDNTFPNLVPLLTGHFVEYYWNETIHDEFYFDSIDLIWKDYAKKGFRTFYAEDSPFTGTFNYIKRGFYDPPTDYYFRPLMLAIESSDVRAKSTWHCIDSVMETDLMYDYLINFARVMDKRPFIAFAMASVITHDFLNSAGYADDPTVRLLELLWEHKVLENSILVMFGDHGLRFGEIRSTYIGKFEERMPFMYIYFPQWFLEKYPEYAKNLRTNQDRLMTVFDVHATMIHLLDLKTTMTPEEKRKISRGSSLLEELSPDRTCEEANILPHWCPCTDYKDVPLDSPKAVNASLALVEDINDKLKPYSHICATLEIETLMDVKLGVANDLVLRFVKNQGDVVNRTVIYGDEIEDVIADYSVTLTTKPGSAVFEGTVRFDPGTDSYSVLGISRINMYGNQSACVNVQQMKIYCYCL